MPPRLIARLLLQRCQDRGCEKIYALHTLEGECIAKSMARTRFEFGVKVSLATTKAVGPDGRLFLAVRDQLPVQPVGHPPCLKHHPDGTAEAHQCRDDCIRIRHGLALAEDTPFGVPGTVGGLLHPCGFR
jgi:hypothetical protein